MYKPEYEWIQAPRTWFNSVVFNSLRLHELQHARLPCTSPTPRACLNTCPSSEWCHPTISSSVSPSPPAFKSFPASGAFLMGLLFSSGCLSTGVSASASVLPINIQGQFPLGLTGLISLQSKGLSRVFFSTTIWKHKFLGRQPSWWSNSHIHTWLLEKLWLWLYRLLSAVGEVMSLLFNMLSRFVITFLPRSKNLLILWLQPPSTVILEPKKIKSVTVSTFFLLFAIKW